MNDPARHKRFLSSANRVSTESALGVLQLESVIVVTEEVAPSELAARQQEEADELDLQDVVAHLWWLDETHDLLGSLYEWDHDPLGYLAGRTCQECGVRSPKHALLDERHTTACRVRVVEEALGIRKLGDKTYWPDPREQETGDE